MGVPTQGFFRAACTIVLSAGLLPSIRYWRHVPDQLASTAVPRATLSPHQDQDRVYGNKASPWQRRTQPGRVRGDTERAQLG